MKRNSLTVIVLSIFSPCLYAQENPAPLPEIDPNQSQRCVPPNVTYTHFGAIDQQTLILANSENDAVVATLKTACPRLLDESRVLLLFQKGDGLSRLETRMCADDAFMLIEAESVAVNNGDSLRACQFSAFYSLPVEDILDLVKTNAIFFRGIGTF